MDVRDGASRLLAPVRPLVRRGRRMTPGYLVVGTKRGGSTSLADWITRHPDVGPCRTGKGTHYFDVHHDRGRAWFLSGFPRASSGYRTTGEASPYYMFHPLAPRRIAETLPHVRVLVVLREPGARAWSHHRYETQLGRETEDFPRALDLEPQRLAGEEERLREDPSYTSPAHRYFAYLRRGHYAEQLERFYALLPAEQILVLRSESLFASPERELDRVWDHIGVPRVRLTGLPRLKSTEAGQGPDPSTTQRLASYYAPWNERLRSLPGVDVTWAQEPQGTRPPPPSPGAGAPPGGPGSSDRGTRGGSQTWRSSTFFG